MDPATQRQKAEAFRKMHDRSKMLVLPNAWDVASAKIFEAAGFSRGRDHQLGGRQFAQAIPMEKRSRATR